MRGHEKRPLSLAGSGPSSVSVLLPNQLLEVVACRADFCLGVLNPTEDVRVAGAKGVAPVNVCRTGRTCLVCARIGTVREVVERDRERGSSGGLDLVVADIGLENEGD